MKIILLILTALVSFANSTENVSEANALVIREVFEILLSEPTKTQVQPAQNIPAVGPVMKSSSSLEISQETLQKINALWFGGLTLTLIILAILHYASKYMKNRETKSQPANESQFEERKLSKTLDNVDSEMVQFFLLKLQERNFELDFDVKKHVRGFPEVLFHDLSALSSCMCSICHEVFNSPRTLECGHTFCKTCLEDYIKTTPVLKSCPECRAFIINYTPNRTVVLDRIVQDSKIRCPSILHDPLTPCKYVGKLSESAAHVQRCCYTRVKCPCGKFIRRIDFANPVVKCDCKVESCKYCFEKVTSRLLSFHSEKCLESEIICKECGQMIKMKDKYNHSVNECFISCPFYGHGCQDKILGYKIYDHIEEKYAEHFIMFMKAKYPKDLISYESEFECHKEKLLKPKEKKSIILT